jgi:hypothetical protein
MEPSSQHEPHQRSQEDLAEGLPEGFPLTREHKHPVEPLERALQDRLDEVMRAKGQPKVKPPRRPSWDHSADA